MAVLLDTSVLFALLDKDDGRHRQAVKLVESGREPLIVPAVVLPEVCYLAHKYLGASVESRFLSGLLDGEMLLERGEAVDLRRAVAILRLRPEFGMVDATVMATAERLNIRRIATCDRRHFGSFQPAHCEAFELYP